MPRTTKRSKLLPLGTLVLSTLLPVSFASAQEVMEEAPATAPKPSGTDGVEILDVVEEPVVIKEFSTAERQRICAKYENQLVAYYGDVWKVERCERRPITNNKTVYELQRSGKQVLDVDSDIVAAIPEGEPLDLAISIKAARGCKELDNRYITYSSVDVYFVERCKKRMFPDWTTYIKHRDQREDKKGEILALSWVEFDQLQPGDDFPSVIDGAFQRLLSGDAGVDVIPVDEACEGVEGKVVSYYSHLYRIERCRKREMLAPGLQLRGEALDARRVPELRSEQWLSLPDGEPLDVPRQGPKPAKSGGTAANTRQ